MAQLIFWTIAALAVYWAYKSGKRFGSRQGFYAGRRFRRRTRHR